jgi:pimeloyl-ACP methyl ester carboxylesterase
VVAVGRQRGDHHNWDRVTPLLATHFTTDGLDRRGRGESDDRSKPGGDDLAREVEDLSAVVGHVGEPVHVLAHSGGAVCALEAALQGADVRSLLLYEPPLDVSADFPRGLADQLQPFADAGDMEWLLVTFLRRGPRLPEAEITAMRASPSWLPRVADALRILREVRLVEAYRPDRHLPVRDG